MSDSERPHNPRMELLSRSASGLHYVREKKSGVLRRLTPEEMQDFEDPPPCEECGEQFGCEHFNCAREPLIPESEVDAQCPEEWRAFARESGISSHDLERLRSIEKRDDGEYHVTAGVTTDMRTLELVLLLNER